MSLAGGLRRRFLGIRVRPDQIHRTGLETTALAGFERISNALISGCHAALEANDAKGLHWLLSTTPRPLRANAYEGAGMGLTMRDLGPTRRDRLGHFSVTYAGPYRYHLHLGVGMALARHRMAPDERLPWLDPLHGWAAADGYGFHETIFRRSPTRPLAPPVGWLPLAQHLYDQGVGRGLWLALGADDGLIRREVRGFPAPRRGALWTGLAFAAAYYGGTPHQLVCCAVNTLDKS